MTIYLISAKYHPLHQFLMDVKSNPDDMRTMIKEFYNQSIYEYSNVGFMEFQKEEHNLESAFIEPYPLIL